MPPQKPGYQKTILIVLPSIVFLLWLIGTLLGHQPSQSTTTSAMIPVALPPVAAAPAVPDADEKAMEAKAAYYDQMTKQADLKMQKQFEQEAKRDQHAVPVNSSDAAEMSTAKDTVQPADPAPESYSSASFTQDSPTSALFTPNSPAPSPSPPSMSPEERHELEVEYGQLQVQENKVAEERKDNFEQEYNSLHARDAAISARLSANR